MSFDLAFGQLLSPLEKPLVLIDLGASGEPPEIWKGLAAYATYIGFDPDKRETHEEMHRQFKRSVLINRAVTPEGGEADLYLTHSPYCSSTLPPSLDQLADYIFSDLFEVESQTKIQATTLDGVIKE